MVNGKAYVMGGMAVHPGTPNGPVNIGTDDTPRSYFTTSRNMTVVSDQWRERTPMPTPRRHFVVAAINGKIFALGGRQGLARPSVGYSSAVEGSDPANDLWLASRTPAGRAAGMSFRRLQGAAICDGGGFRNAFSSFENVRAMEVYEPAGNQWFMLPSVPGAESNLRRPVIGDTLYLLSNDGIKRASGGGWRRVRNRTHSTPSGSAASSSEKRTSLSPVRARFRRERAGGTRYATPDA